MYFFFFEGKEEMSLRGNKTEFPMSVYIIFLHDTTSVVIIF